MSNRASGSRSSCAASCGLVGSALFACGVLYAVQPGSRWFSWHPTLMTLAFGLLTQPAVALLMPRPLPVLRAIGFQRRRVFLHWALQVTSLSCSAVGFWVAYTNKDLLSKPHLTSWHAWAGVAALCLSWTTAVLGLATLWKRVLAPRTSRSGHVFLAALSHTLAVGALLSGLRSTYFDALVPGVVPKLCLAALPCASLAAVLSQTLRL
uniref:ascorbate ferrireductase (transmembrane) n=2 Tax=Ixodes ricinus TaxID=34613 RepID=A0A131YAZ5_IXORI